MNLSFASNLAGRIAEELKPFCTRLEIAGSIRRQRPEVGDIDIVCLPNGLRGRDEILARCSRDPAWKKLKEGEQYVVFEFTLQGRPPIQLDLWFAHDASADLLGEKTLCNWAVLLLARTGSAMHNVYIAQQAQAMGLHFNPHAGISRRGVLIDTPEEADLFAALGMTFVRPERRER